jgi:DMSO/TMAO reductase YedYZ heme-binding membrane subunit
MVVVGLSFYVRRFIGQKAWRYLHFGAFGAYAAATAHGVMAGSDTAHPVVLTMYLATGVSVLVLVAARVTLSGGRSGSRPAPSARPAARSERPPSGATRPAPAPEG